MQRTVDKYEILQEIGHGGMATVYRARDTKLDRLVALKVLHPHLRGSAEARARFRREAQGVARLRHPRVLEIYDYSGEDSEESYIATELLTGPTLRIFIERHESVLAEIAACFAIEMCRALGAAHQNGIVHRDVKPENILIHEDRVIKLTDFGIADMVDSQTMTATGQILGSPGHMAPEQIEGRDCDARTDVFALGTVLYFLACGRLPFTGRNPHQVLKRISEGDFPDPLRVKPAIGEKLRAILLRALATDPAARYPNVSEFERDLQAFIGESRIEDASGLLERYLRDPEDVEAATTAQVVSVQIGLGKKARERRDTAAAMDFWGRALSLDGENAEVLDLLRTTNARARTRRLVAMSVFALLTVASTTSIAWYLEAAAHEISAQRLEASKSSKLDESAAPGSSRSLALPSDGNPTARAGGPSAGADASAFEALPGTEAASPPEVASSVEAAAEAEEPGSGSDPNPASPGATVVAIREESTATANAPNPARRTRRPTPTSVAGAPRPVQFLIDPANVSIGVDGETPRAWGSAFRDFALSPGRHRFLIRANIACCSDATVDVIVPPGEEPFVVQRRLASAPAGLVVLSNVPADVVFEDGQRRRANDTITIPIQSPDRRETISFVVSATGYADRYERIELRAGEARQIRVSLRPEGVVD